LLLFFSFPFNGSFLSFRSTFLSSIFTFNCIGSGLPLWLVSMFLFHVPLLLVRPFMIWVLLYFFSYFCAHFVFSFLFRSTLVLLTFACSFIISFYELMYRFWSRQDLNCPSYWAWRALYSVALGSFNFYLLVIVSGTLVYFLRSHDSLYLMYLILLVLLYSLLYLFPLEYFLYLLLALLLLCVPFRYMAAFAPRLLCLHGHFLASLLASYWFYTSLFFILSYFFSWSV
jgi:hypothetical protein